jgi:DNA-binding GntR family transcriptional regulator
MRGIVATIERAALRRISRQGSTPLWLQLKHALRDLITFDLGPDDQIPTETQLCDAYSLSRVTVRQAITSLVDEGLLERRQGRGTFVVSPRLAQSLGEPEHFLLNGFDAARPDSVAVFSRETVAVPEWIAARLGLPSDAPVFKIRKLLTAGSERVAFRTSYIPLDVAPTLLEADLHPPLSLTLERGFGVALASADETIEFIVADAFRAEMLDVAEEHPLILVERIVSCARGRGVECSRTFYKADRFRFSHRLENKERRAG